MDGFFYKEYFTSCQEARLKINFCDINYNNEKSTYTTLLL